MSNPRERVVVLGAGGFIGRQVTAALAQTDWAIPVAAIHKNTFSAPPGTQIVRVDATQAAEVSQALDGAAAVVCCVIGNRRTIVDSARILFDCASRIRPFPRIIYLSTMSVYGSATGTVDESAPLRGDLGAYSAAKVTAEELSLDYPNTVRLRPGIVYGPGSTTWNGLLGRWLFARRLGDLGPVGEGFCNLVHVRDVATAVVRALRTPGIEGRAFNLSLPSPLSWNDYFIRYAHALGAVPVRRVPAARIRFERNLDYVAPPWKIAVRLMNKAGIDTSALPTLIHPSFIRLFRQKIHLATGNAERILGLQWTPLDEGLKEAAAWFLGSYR